MATKDEKMKALETAIVVTRYNLGSLTKANKKDPCGCGESRPHYHELIMYDLESGDEYFEKREATHRRLITRLTAELGRLEKRLQVFTVAPPV